MRRLTIVSLLVLAAVVVAGCAAIQQQKAAPPQSEFRNLQVFPPNIPHDELINAMRSFSRGLGTRCDGCHVVTKTEPKQEFDFASDAKANKKIARTMLRMTMNINDNWISRLPREADAPPQTAENTPRVSCWTCHRGKMEPEAPPPPPAPQQH
ncbi:MAG TPA: c-type cytochrome [Thermoanaerobaculia bacterium]|nr:c-type cytochrome [Thermoanaerobaculia bacterium]